MAVFKIGDKVEAIDDVISGIVSDVNGTSVTVDTDDDFSMVFDAKELVVITGNITVSNYEVAQVKKEKELPKKRRPAPPKPKERNLPKMEVDLHINQLVKNSKGLGNYEMLNLQLDTAKRQLEFAISKRIQKVVFIHGVGEGVLKEELRYLFNKYENVKHYDADYQKYGLGATEVYIYQNA
ncbi:Smr/MutS family protein [Maribacter chungangensis]|uniref:Smr/MutS family protein n=1 Tax=Maribacter chungangensis TaxID=1069117 RepID=A0ABW3B7R0_9FLAO